MDDRMPSAADMERAALERRNEVVQRLVTTVLPPAPLAIGSPAAHILASAFGTAPVGAPPVFESITDAATVAAQCAQWLVHSPLNTEPRVRVHLVDDAPPSDRLPHSDERLASAWVTFRSVTTAIRPSMLQEFMRPLGHESTFMVNGPNTRDETPTMSMWVHVSALTVAVQLPDDLPIPLELALLASKP